jgi:hypothetical protein
MKKKTLILLLAFLTPAVFAQKKPAAKGKVIPVKTEPVPVEATAAAPAPVPAEKEEPFVSPYIEKGLPADAMRTMLLDADLAANVKNNKQLWLGNILRIGLFTRPRAENRQNLNFSVNNTESINRIGQNSQIWFFMNPSRDTEIKITLQDSRVWGGDGGAKSAAGVDDRAAYFSGGDYTTAANPHSTLDVREAYVQFRNMGIAGVGLQAGRQVLAYGDQRMLGGANWNVSGLSFDGVLLKYDGNHFSSHLFAVQGTTASGNNPPNGIQSESAAAGNSYLGGMYNTLKSDFAWLELYGIGISRNIGVDSLISSTSSSCVNCSVISTSSANLQYTTVYTFGSRLTNRTDNNKLPVGRRWDFTLEAAFQTGKASDLTYIDASGNSVTNNSRMYNGKLFYAQTGYKILDDLRLGAHVFYSPGTEDRTGSAVNTFQSMPGPRFGTFPYLNNFNGISENMGLKNIFTPSVTITYDNKKWGNFTLTYLYENKATTQDAWYGISGAANSSFTGRISTEDAKNSGSVALGKNIYQELDFFWMKQFSNYFSIWIGVGYLRAGDAVSNARGGDFKADGFMSFLQLTGAL